MRLSLNRTTDRLDSVSLEIKTFSFICIFQAFPCSCKYSYDVDAFTNLLNSHTQVWNIFLVFWDRKSTNNSYCSGWNGMELNHCVNHSVMPFAVVYGNKSNHLLKGVWSSNGMHLDLIDICLNEVFTECE